LSAHPSGEAIDYSKPGVWDKVESALESRSDIAYRFYAFLGKVFEQCAQGTLVDVLICVTHLEVLWDYVQPYNSDEFPLAPGEIIRLDLDRDPETGTIRVSTLFRGDTYHRTCRSPNNLFMQQFKL
jgi:hypothetical protein